MDIASWIEAASAALTAAFTVVLAIATIRLWNSTKGLHKETVRLANLAEAQSADMKASIEVARRAADAAELNARAAIGVELPIIHIERVACDPEPPTSESKISDWCNSFSPKLTIHNFGRTHAFLTKILVSGVIGTPSKDPLYDEADGEGDSTVIKAGDSYEAVQWQFSASSKFTLSELKAVVSGDKNLFLYGYVAYKDFIGTEHKQGFIWRWNSKMGFCSSAANHYPKYDIQT